LQLLAHKAYGEIHTRTASDRDIEFALFDQITKALSEVNTGQDAPPARRADAVSRNLQLWTLLSSDLISEANALDIATKRGLLNLGHYVRRRSMQALADTSDLSDLIDINTTLMQAMQPGREPAIAQEGA
jgi:flagellar biosynthesis activator protein FlaF